MRESLSKVLNSLTQVATEGIVLGEMMCLGDAKHPKVQEAFLILTLDCFTLKESKNLFSIIKDESQKNGLFDEIHMLDLIPNTEEYTSTYQYMSECILKQKSAASLIPDALKLKVSRDNRNSIKILGRLLTGIIDYSDPHIINELIHDSLSKISKTQAERFAPKTIQHITDLYFQGYYKNMVKYPTGIESLDHPTRLNGGFDCGTLVTIAAQSGHGKTYFGLYLAINMGMQNRDKQVLFYNLEMTDLAMMKRYYSLKLNKTFNQISEDEHKISYLDLNQPDINVYPSEAEDIHTIITTARYEHQKKPVSVIIIDYIGIIETKGNKDEMYQKQIMIARKLNALAIELNCVVIVLSQVNRNHATRQDKRPLITDSADSMGTQRASSYWLGLYQPQIDDPNTNMKNILNVTCRKSREGGLFDINFGWDNGCISEIKYPQEYSFNKTNPWSAKKNEIGELN